MKTCLALLIGLLSLSSLPAQELVFRDDFKGKLGQGWTWIREHPEAWRTTERGLEVKMEPGNMWGSANNARNVLVRPLPEPGAGELEIQLNIQNQPSHQYEQVDLVWYYSDSNMVKLGQELVDGKLSIVMGREAEDKTRTIAIVPLDSGSVTVRFLVKGNTIVGEFRTPASQTWTRAGQTDLPTSGSLPPRISLQFYQGAEKEERWALVNGFKIERKP